VAAAQAPLHGKEVGIADPKDWPTMEIIAHQISYLKILYLFDQLFRRIN